MATANSKPLLGPQSIESGTRPPTAAAMRALADRDRTRVLRIISLPIEFIGHESFPRITTGRELFGGQVGPEASTRPWCNAAGVTARSCGATVWKTTLTGKQEQRLFLRLNYARYRMFRILDERAGKPLTGRLTSELLWWSDRAEETKSEIVQANVPLVLAMAKRTRMTHVDYAELISEGNMALLRSVDKFDCARGFKLSTYACRAILKSFSRVALRTSRYRGKFPTEFDPALERSDFLDQRRVIHEADCVDEIRGILHANRAELNEVEATVIKARFAIERVPGLEGDGPKTLEQVGVLIGVTKERVRQIQNRALSKLRSALQEDFLAA